MEVDYGSSIDFYFVTGVKKSNFPIWWNFEFCLSSFGDFFLPILRKKNMIFQVKTV